MITENFTILKVYVFPDLNGLQNVVGKVFWEFSLEEDGAMVGGAGETLIDVSTVDPSTFIPVEDLTDSQISEWVKATMGDQWNESYTFALGVLAERKKEIGLVEWIPPEV